MLEVEILRYTIREQSLKDPITFEKTILIYQRTFTDKLFHCSRHDRKNIEGRSRLSGLQYPGEFQIKCTVLWQQNWVFF